MITAEFQACTASFSDYTIPPVIVPLTRLLLCLNAKIYNIEKLFITDPFSPLLLSEKRPCEYTLVLLYPKVNFKTGQQNFIPE